MSTLEQRAAAYAASQYEISHTNVPGCVHMNTFSQWTWSHGHQTWGDAEICRDASRSRCVARVLTGEHSEFDYQPGDRPARVA